MPSTDCLLHKQKPVTLFERNLANFELRLMPHSLNTFTLYTFKLYMIRAALFLLLVLVGYVSPVLAQFDPTPNNTGQSAYGYRRVTEGVNYEWITLDPDNGAQVLTSGTLTDDNFFGPVNIGFDFPYFWNTYNQLYIGSNGYVMFGGAINVASQATGFPQFPNDVAIPNNYIGILLSDLTFTDHDGEPVRPNGQPARVLYQTIDNRFIITFENVPFWVREQEDPKAYRGSNTFQLILNGNDRSMKFQYKSCEGPVSDAYQGLGTNFITRGFENNIGRHGLNFTPNVYPSEEAILVVFEEPQQFVLNDVSADWLFNSRNQGLTVVAGSDPFGTPAQITNSGTTRMTNIRVSRVVNPIVTDPSDTDRPDDFRQTIEISALEPGESRTVEFNRIRFNDIKVYRINLNVSAGGDAINANNTRTARVVVIDTSSVNANIQPGKPGIPVGFDTYLALSQRGASIWPEGSIQPPITSANVGMYLNPPYYPAYVSALEFGIVIFNRFALQQPPPRDELAGFEAEVYEERNGEKGDKLFSIVVRSDQYNYIEFTEQDALDGIITQFLNYRVPLPRNIELRDGQGLYVSYRRLRPDSPEERALDFLAVDNSREVFAFPSSSRSYEITGGHWAPNRSRDELDFPIRIVVTPRPVSRAGKQSPVQIGGIYPNPASHEFEVSYNLLESGPVEIALYDQLGREIERQNLGHQLFGNQTYRFDTRNLSEGIYLVQVKSGLTATTTKLVISR